MDPVLKKIEEIYLEMKSIHQQNEKMIAKHTRRINLHDTTLRYSLGNWPKNYIGDLKVTFQVMGQSKREETM